MQSLRALGPHLRVLFLGGGGDPTAALALQAQAAQIYKSEPEFKPSF